MKQINNNFEILRLIASLMVFISHAFLLISNVQVNTSQLILTKTLEYDLGFIGVAIFFVISGYLITQSWESTSSTSSFLIKRIKRIFPGLIGVILFSVFILGVGLNSQGLNYLFYLDTWKYLLNTLLITVENLPFLFKNNIYYNTVNGSLWSLPYEFVLYLVVMLLGFVRWLNIINRRYLITLFIAFLLIFIGLANDNFYLSLQFFNYEILLFFKYSIFFISGIIMYMYKEHVALRSSIAIILFLIILVLFNTLYNLLILYIALPYIVIFFAHSLPLKTLITFTFKNDLSYGIYLYGFVIQQSIIQLFNNNINTTQLIIISLPIIVLLAFLSWNLIEKKYITR